MYRQSIDVWVVSTCPKVVGQVKPHNQGYHNLGNIRDREHCSGHGLTPMQRNNNASIENANGAASHEKRRKTMK
jgi:hypothetical protein